MEDNLQEVKGQSPNPEHDPSKINNYYTHSQTNPSFDSNSQSPTLAQEYNLFPYDHSRSVSASYNLPNSTSFTNSNHGYDAFQMGVDINTNPSTEQSPPNEQYLYNEIRDQYNQNIPVQFNTNPESDLQYTQETQNINYNPEYQDQFAENQLYPSGEYQDNQFVQYQDDQFNPSYPVQDNHSNSYDPYSQSPSVQYSPYPVNRYNHDQNITVGYDQSYNQPVEYDQRSNQAFSELINYDQVSNQPSDLHTTNYDQISNQAYSQIEEQTSNQSHNPDDLYQYIPVQENVGVSYNQNEPFEYNQVQEQQSFVSMPYDQSKEEYVNQDIQSIQPDFQNYGYSNTFNEPDRNLYSINEESAVNVVAFQDNPEQTYEYRDDNMSRVQEYDNMDMNQQSFDYQNNGIDSPENIINEGDYNYYPNEFNPDASINDDYEPDLMIPPLITETLKVDQISSNCQMEESSIVNRISAIYYWTVPLISSYSDDSKLISPAFGPADWRWQGILYPRGVGDGKGTHISSYLRPLKSQSEIESGEEWQRPVIQFTFRVRDQGAQKPIYHSESSLSTLTAFDSSTPGWGFQQFINLEESTVLVDEFDSLYLEIEVCGDILVNIEKCLYSWGVSSLNSLPFESEPFGPTNYQWQLVFEECAEDPTFFEAYLLPFKNVIEIALGDDFERLITSFTVKLNDDSNICKSITGGCKFDIEKTKYGWNKFSPLVDGAFICSVEIVWEKRSHYSKVESLLERTLKEEYLLENNYATMNQTGLIELESKLLVAKEEMNKLRTFLSETQAAYDESSLTSSELLEKTMKLKRMFKANRARFIELNEENSTLKKELIISNEARLSDTNQLGKLKFDMMKLKGSLLRIHQVMTLDSSDNKTPIPDNEHYWKEQYNLAISNNSNIQIELSKLNIKLDSLESQNMYLESELNRTINLNSQDNNQVEEDLESIPSDLDEFEQHGIDDEPRDPTKIEIESMITNIRVELDNSIKSLKSVVEKLVESSSSTVESWEIEKTSLCAELVMIQAEVEVANAALVEAKSKSSKLESDGFLAELQNEQLGVLYETLCRVRQEVLSYLIQIVPENYSYLNQSYNQQNYNSDYNQEYNQGYEQPKSTQDSQSLNPYQVNEEYTEQIVISTSNSTSIQDSNNNIQLLSMSQELSESRNTIEQLENEIALLKDKLNLRVAPPPSDIVKKETNRYVISESPTKHEVQSSPNTNSLLHNRFSKKETNDSTENNDYQINNDQENLEEQLWSPTIPSKNTPKPQSSFFSLSKPFFFTLLPITISLFAIMVQKACTSTLPQLETLFSSPKVANLVFNKCKVTNAISLIHSFHKASDSVLESGMYGISKILESGPVIRKGIVRVSKMFGSGHDRNQSEEVVDVLNEVNGDEDLSGVPPLEEVIEYENVIRDENIGVVVVPVEEIQEYEPVIQEIKPVIQPDIQETNVLPLEEIQENEPIIQSVIQDNNQTTHLLPLEEIQEHEPVIQDAHQQLQEIDPVQNGHNQQLQQNSPVEQDNHQKIQEFVPVHEIPDTYPTQQDHHQNLNEFAPPPSQVNYQEIPQNGPIPYDNDQKIHGFDPIQPDNHQNMKPIVPVPLSNYPDIQNDVLRQYNHQNQHEFAPSPMSNYQQIPTNNPVPQDNTQSMNGFSSIFHDNNHEMAGNGPIPQDNHHHMRESAPADQGNYHGIPENRPVEHVNHQDVNGQAPINQVNYQPEPVNDPVPRDNHQNFNGHIQQDNHPNMNGYAPPTQDNYQPAPGNGLIQQDNPQNVNGYAPTNHGNYQQTPGNGPVPHENHQNFNGNAPVNEENYQQTPENAPIHQINPQNINGYATSNQGNYHLAPGNGPINQHNQQNVNGYAPANHGNYQQTPGNPPVQQNNYQNFNGHPPANQFNYQHTPGNHPVHQDNPQNMNGNAPVNHDNYQQTPGNVPFHQDNHQNVNGYASANQGNHHQTPGMAPGNHDNHQNIYGYASANQGNHHQTPGMGPVHQDNHQNIYGNAPVNQDNYQGIPENGPINQDNHQNVNPYAPANQGNYQQTPQIVPINHQNVNGYAPPNQDNYHQAPGNGPFHRNNHQNMYGNAPVNQDNYYQSPGNYLAQQNNHQKMNGYAPVNQGGNGPIHHDNHQNMNGYASLPDGSYQRMKENTQEIDTPVFIAPDDAIESTPGNFLSLNMPIEHESLSKVPLQKPQTASHTSVSIDANPNFSENNEAILTNPTENVNHSYNDNVGEADQEDTFEEDTIESMIATESSKPNIDSSHFHHSHINSSPSIIMNDGLHSNDHLIETKSSSFNSGFPPISSNFIPPTTAFESNANQFSHSLDDDTTTDTISTLETMTPIEQTSIISTILEKLTTILKDISTSQPLSNTTFIGISSSLPESLSHTDSIPSTNSSSQLIQSNLTSIHNNSSQQTSSTNVVSQIVVSTEPIPIPSSESPIIFQTSFSSNTQSTLIQFNIPVISVLNSESGITESSKQPLISTQSFFTTESIYQPPQTVIQIESSISLSATKSTQAFINPVSQIPLSPPIQPHSAISTFTESIQPNSINPIDSVVLTSKTKATILPNLTLKSNIEVTNETIVKEPVIEVTRMKEKPRKSKRSKGDRKDKINTKSQETKAISTSIDIEEIKPSSSVSPIISAVPEPESEELWTVEPLNVNSIVTEPSNTELSPEERKIQKDKFLKFFKNKKGRRKNQDNKDESEL